MDLLHVMNTLILPGIMAHYMNKKTRDCRVGLLSHGIPFFVFSLYNTLAYVICGWEYAIVLIVLEIGYCVYLERHDRAKRALLLAQRVREAREARESAVLLAASAARSCELGPDDVKKIFHEDTLDPMRLEFH